VDVLYERLPYYAYRSLDESLPLKDRFRVRKVLHMLLRLNNWHQPVTVACLANSHNLARYIKAGCNKAQVTDNCPDKKIDLCWLDEPDNEVLTHLHEHSVLLLDHLNKHKDWFMSLPSVISFDLYDIGIAFFDTKYNKQHYIVNF
jgi:hypothetical protein